MKNMRRKMALLLAATMAFSSVDAGMVLAVDDVHQIEETAEVVGIQAEALEEESVPEGETYEGEEVAEEEELITDIIEPEEMAEAEEYVIGEETAVSQSLGDGSNAGSSWSLEKHEVNITAKFGESIEFKVPFTEDSVPGTDMTYCWLLNGNEIEKTKDATFTVDTRTLIHAKQQAPQALYYNEPYSYKCILEDATEQQLDYVNFNLYLSKDTNIRIYTAAAEDEENWEGRFIGVATPGKEFTLQFQATSLEAMNPVWTYQWYTYDTTTAVVTLLPGETHPTYQKISDASDVGKIYGCVVSDGTSSTYIEFRMVSGSGFTYMEQSANDNGKELVTRVIPVKENKTVILSPENTTEYGTMSYLWLYGIDPDYKEELGDQIPEEDILGTGATYTVTTQDNGAYLYCYVTDGYESQVICYQITYDGLPEDMVFQAQAEQEKVIAEKGEEVTLRVEAQITEGFGLYYYWFKVNTETNGTQAIQHVGEDVKEYTFKKDADGIEIYGCRVYYGNQDDAKFVFFLVGSQKDMDNIIPEAADFEHARTISLYGPESVISLKEKGKQYFKIIPDKDGMWNVKDEGATELVLYNANKEMLCSTRNGESGVVYRLKANETYYIEATFCMPDTPNGPLGLLTSIEAVYLDYNTAHKWQAPAILRAATCTTEGYWKISCASCDLVYYETVPALGHHYGEALVTREATCTTEGEKTITCSGCGNFYTEAIPKIAHTYGEYTVKTKPTAAQYGVKVRTCQVCGVTEEAKIDKLISHVTFTLNPVPLQVKQKVSLKRIIKGLEKEDRIVSCTSDNRKIAIVDKNGVVTGKKEGKTKITVKFLSGATAKVTMKVQKKKVATSKITNVTRNITLKVKKSTKLAPVVTPITSKNKVTYKTSNKKIATVSSKGVIKAKKAGTATITVKSGSKTVKVKVKVTK